MTERLNTAGQHGLAADHHDRAARYHREAGRHYEIGKDFAHAAHMALLAHGHTSRALDHGRQAGQYYAGRHAAEATEPKPPAPVKSDDTATTLETRMSAAEHHAAAAANQDHAARHHREAARRLTEIEDEQAVSAARIAHRHAHFAVFHGDEAAMHHVEHYGKAHPTAEIA